MLTLQDAKNRFSAVVEAALSGRPQAVSRRGKPAVVVLAATEYDRLVKVAGGERGSFLDHLRSLPIDPEEETRPEVAPRKVAF